MNRRSSKSSRKTLRRSLCLRWSLSQPGDAVSTVWFAKKKKNRTKLRRKMMSLRQSRCPNPKREHLRLSQRILNAHTSNMLIPKPRSSKVSSIKICKWRKRRGKNQNSRISWLRDKLSLNMRRICRRWKSTRSTILKHSSINRIKNSRAQLTSLMRFSLRCFITSSLLSQCLMLSAVTKEGLSLIKAELPDRPIKRR